GGCSRKPACPWRTLLFKAAFRACPPSIVCFRNTSACLRRLIAQLTSDWMPVLRVEFDNEMRPFRDSATMGASIYRKGVVDYGRLGTVKAAIERRIEAEKAGRLRA